MRFSLATAALATMAVGVVAAEEPVQTVIVTETATFCPKVSTLPAETTVTQPAPASATNVRYSTTRPLITSTVTRCNKCASKTKSPVVSVPSNVNPVPGVPSNAPSSSGGSVVIPSSSAAPSVPLIPSAPAPSGVAPSGPAPSGVLPSGSATTPAAPIFTGGASRAAAGAGAGLATVFGLVAYLL
ncbi:hypothetical protein P170DRAFT_511698 [Aspergillus steynii IBT 23096]|uniref:GPI anchored protein n=1 Tax=Aspergillus steynii IBT 23096 TaxID=1392250 RepID=A0A2I2G2F1_9EURO|nr:uncharacterized protein P170DRAFT_511698 [Aspergillus steynii IBT 23096]PLB47045.1 hypothetical protein P170DRAFT_511698 [Aspergillus steynii IBT 23096]